MLKSVPLLGKVEIVAKGVRILKMPKPKYQIKPKIQKFEVLSVELKIVSYCSFGELEDEEPKTWSLILKTILGI